MASSRNSNYTVDEDRHLCHVYLEISQDPIIGINQKKDQFWGRVTEAYNSTKPSESWPDRSLRSINSRMQGINSAISKFKGCVQQMEYARISGASEQDIMNRAKDLMAQDKKFDKGFRFEHVWDIMKDFVKHDCKSQKPRAIYSSESGHVETQIPESPISSDQLASFYVNLSDDSGSGSGSQRPLGVKKSKLKKKRSDDVSVIVNTIKEESAEMRSLFRSSIEDREEERKIQRDKIEATKMAAASRKLVAYEYSKMSGIAQTDSENKILMTDTTNLDPNTRLYFEQEKARILFKRQQQSTRPNNDFDFGSYFPDIGDSGSGSGLGDY